MYWARKRILKISKGKLKDIIRLGFINGGKKEGDFEFEIRYIEFE